ncbi:MAG: hypothetical protein E6356_17010, partial [Terrisporobacter othiniensis]|nr:hypothetical protein [Terrisporobacter othiniensis]
YNLWFTELKTYMGRPYQLSSLDYYMKYVTDSEVLKYIKENIESIKNNKGVFIDENLLKVQETETVEEVEVVEEKQEVEETKNETIEDVKIVLNEDKNGVEIYFSGKPSEDVRNNLKSNGFRWSRYNKCWYTKQSEDTLKFANSLTNTTEEEIKEVSAQYKEEKEKEVENKLNELNINDIDSYVIDANLSRRENESYLFRSKDVNHTKEIQEYFESANNEVLSVLENCTDKNIEYNLKMALQRFKRDYYNNYVSRLQNKASNPSWMVSGRGGLNTNKYNKMNDRYNNLLLKSNEIVDKFNKSINRAKNEMKKQHKQELETAINNTNVEDYSFTRCKKQYNLSAADNIFLDPNAETNMTTYNNEYFIFKNWAKYTIYNSEGKEIACRNSLKDAKKYLIMLLEKAA